MNIYTQTMSYVIYKATCLVNQKSYIGKTKNFNKRYNSHKSSSNNIKEKDFNSVFHRAIRKYGFENFKWEIIYQSNDELFVTYIMESYFIKIFNTYIGIPNNRGYNMTTGGEGLSGFKKPAISNHTRKLMSISQTGKILTENHKSNISQSNKGHITTQETKDKISKANKGRKYTDEVKLKIYCKKYIIIFPNGNKETIVNLKEFCKENNLHDSCMNKVSNGIQTHHKGFKCKKLE